jgi:hypothetical protein
MRSIAWTARKISVLMAGALVGATAFQGGVARCEEPSMREVLERLERTEQQLAATQARLDQALRGDDEAPPANCRLPAVEEPALADGARFICASDRSIHDDVADNPPTDIEMQVEQLGQSVEQLGAGMEQMKEGVEELGKALRVTTAHEYSKMAFFATIRGEALWSSARPIVPGAPLLLTPGPLPGTNFDQDSFDVHAKSTLLGAGFIGPELGCYETGGMILFALFSETVVQDIYGILPLLAFGEIKSDNGRFAAGLQFDVFNPINPMMVNFMTLWASGNTGAYRGQMRLERYYYPTCDSQWTMQVAIGEALPTLIINNRIQGTVLSEDNGIPNLEGRIALGLGMLEGEGLEAHRPLEIGLSGMAGQIRSTTLPATRVVADVWGLGADGRLAINHFCGVQGEVFYGQTLGTYLGGVGQTVNLVTLEGIRSQGGWGEFYVYLTPCVHAHFGYGIDDPKDEDLAPTQRELNETVYGTVFWELTESLRLGLEVSYRETDYFLLPDNDGILVHTQVQWTF